MSIKVAKIAVSAATFHIDKPYEYLIPDSIIYQTVPGMRVLVPFGSGNRKTEGVVLSIVTESGQKRLKSIDSLLDNEPVLNEENIQLAIWMSDRFFCTVFEALRVMLPAGMWFKEGVRRQGDKTVRIAVLRISAEIARSLAEEKKKQAPRQAEVLENLAANGSMTVDELQYFSESSLRALRALEKQELIRLEEREVFRRPTISARCNSAQTELNEQQQAVFEKIAPLIKSSKPEAALLFGVTGSGKTHVYICLIKEALALGKNAIVLVPEIALTPQTVSIFASYFGDSVAVLHSALSTGERYDEWKRIRSGAVTVVVGTRSAIFAPLANIGLIVLDEEQEHTYKSEASPRYHAREIAKFRVSRSCALLLLSSATPSIESMWGAKSGKYNLFRIGSRYNEKDLPEVTIADMRSELKRGNGGSISSILRRELEKNIQDGQQSILFINRRGTNPLVACGECGFTFKCKHCSVSMTYHSTNQRLMCHYCGFSFLVPNDCQDCGGKLKFVGAGTQKVESELGDLFPGISIIRMDSDTVTRLNSHDKLLSKFREGKAQVLLGTQMVTKGLDFENVTLVGVLSADSSLFKGDFRAFEKTFSLITQVVGRSGRGEKTGRAIIQTFTPEHEVIKLASMQDYDGFYDREVFFRQSLGCPPIRDILTLVASGISEPAVYGAVIKLRGMLENYFNADTGIKILGPAPAPIPKVKNRFKYRLLVICSSSKDVRDTIAHTIREFSRDSKNRGVSVFADADVYD